MLSLVPTDGPIPYRWVHTDYRAVLIQQGRIFVKESKSLQSWFIADLETATVELELSGYLFVFLFTFCQHLIPFPGIIIVTKTLTSSVNELALLLFFWFIGVIIFGSIMYYIGRFQVNLKLKTYSFNIFSLEIHFDRHCLALLPFEMGPDVIQGSFIFAQYTHIYKDLRNEFQSTV